MSIAILMMLQSVSDEVEAAAAERRRNQALDSFASHESIAPAKPGISPIATLPFEILAYIFSLSIPSVDPYWLFGETFPKQRGGYDPEVPFHLRAPAVLLEVCKRWREVAIGTPLLWTRILIEDPDSPQELSRAALHVTYSGDLPLVLHIRNKSNYSRYFPSPRTSLLRILVPHARRWCELVLGETSFSVDELRSLPPASSTGLTVAGTHATFATFNAQFWPWALSSPMLKRAIFTCYKDFPPNLMKQTACMVSEVSLRGRALAMSQVLGFLQSCPSLEMLHADTFESMRSDDSDIDLPFVECPNLHTLMLGNNAPDFYEFFQHLRTPQLLHLAVDDRFPYTNKRPRELVWAAVCELLVQSGATLRRFFYSGYERQLMDYIHLDPFKDLEELSTFRMLVSPAFFEMLTLDGTNQRLPKLKELTLGLCQGDGEGSLGRMIRSRKGTLRVLEINGIMPPFDRAALRSARADDLIMYYWA
ncbi:hypothetical protein EV714DRAFT_275565 [Schizophyllum commune]